MSYSPPPHWTQYGALILAGVAGVALGIVAFCALVAFVPPMIANYPAPPHEEFGLSKGRATYYVVLSLGALAGTIAVSFSRLSAVLRAFLASFATVLLGGFALCDVFSVPQMFSSN